MKRARDDNVCITLNRCWWRSDVRKALWQYLSILSRAVMLEAIFPALTETIRAEMIIGDRAFETPELSVAQVLHFGLQTCYYFSEYASRSNRPELFELVPPQYIDKFKRNLLRSKNIEMLRFLKDITFSCSNSILSDVLDNDRDDPARVQALQFDNFYMNQVYSNAVIVGAWKTAEFYRTDLELTSEYYIEGAIRSKTFWILDKYFVNNINLFDCAEFDVLVHVKDRISVPLAMFVYACLLKEQAEYVVRLKRAGYFYEPSCDASNCRGPFEVMKVFVDMNILVFKTTYMSTDTLTVKYLLEKKLLSCNSSIVMASYDCHFETLKFLLQQIPLHQYEWDVMMQDAVSHMNMRLLRLLRRFGAVPSAKHCIQAIQMQQKYIYNWLVKRIRGRAEKYLVLSELKKYGWHKEEKALLNDVLKKI